MKIVYTISILVITSSCYKNITAQWSNNPLVNTPVCVWNSYQQIPSIVSDERGGAIISWVDGRLGGSDIFIQRLNAEGYNQWTEGGNNICLASGIKYPPNIIIDGSGGCILVWRDDRNGNFDIYAQRIDSSGNIQWDSAGVEICVLPLDQEDPQIVSDGSGGAIIMWEFKQGTAGETGIYAQRINSLGQIMWSVNGIPVVTSPSAPPIQILPEITADGFGGAIIAWIENTLDEFISAQRINGSGLIQWPPNGQPICTSGNDKRFQNLINVGNGEFVLCWNEEIFFDNWDLRAQKIDTSGTLIWNDEGVVVCSSDVSFNPSAIAFDKNDAVIVGWEDDRNGSTIYCQKIDLDGNIQWQPNGVSVTNINGWQAYIQLTCDTEGNTVACWFDARTNSLWDIYAQKFDGSGIILWEVEGREVSIANSYKSSKNIAITKYEDYIVTWSDERNADPDIYAQSLNSLITSIDQLSSESPISFFLNQNYPNPFNPSTKIKFTIPASPNPSEGWALVQLNIFDILGNEIATLVNEEKHAGTYEVNWDASGLPSGIYFYQLKTEEFIATKKMLLMK